MKLIDLQTEIEKRRSEFIPLQNPETDDLNDLIAQFWTWHFDDSISELAKVLLSTPLKWRKISLINVPIGKIISPLGRALSHEDQLVRESALTLLSSRVEIPAGRVLIGVEKIEVDVPNFEMGRYPITNAQYRRFISETDHRAPIDWEDREYPKNFGDHPVTSVSAKDAEAYADWIGGRLPRFDEWKRATRGDDDRLFPWGDEIDQPRCNTAEAGAGSTTPVGTFPSGKSPFGCYDLIGNVWEWTATPYDDHDQFRIVRGGAWYYNHEHASCVSYDFFSKDYAEFVIGFRVAFDR